MALLAHLWLPIVLSAVFVFIASSVINMFLKFWHAPDYKGFSNEDDVAAAIRKGNPSAGAYQLPYCSSPEAMKQPQMAEKFKNGPVGMVFLRKPGPMNIGSFLGQWFAFCLLVTFFCALVAVHVFGPGAESARIFHVVGLIALMTFSFGGIPDAIWWSHPWGSTLKYVVDGLIYALITGATFAWLWPGAST
jgi:hypothetical protein